MAIRTPAPESPTPDGDLLRRFVADRDEAAFELLVWRHSRLVYEVCRRVLRHRQDAEDATQAAFLVLARRADTVRTAVGGWLARVAYRCALNLASGRREPAVLVEQQPAHAGRSPESTDLPDLDAELNRLPDRYRLPLVLCCLQGLSYSEAATQLNVKPGTLSGRLSRAKALLRDRLVARGVVVPAAAFAVYLSELPNSSAYPPELVRTILTAAGSPRAAAVADGVTRMLSFQTFARRSAALLAAVVLFVGGTVAARLLADDPKPVAKPADPPKEKAKPDKELIQGDWVFDSAEEVGGTNGIHQAWQSVVSFESDKLTLTRYHGLDWKTTFTLDPAESPKRFDMTVNELAKKVMGFKDGTLKGIYRFDGDSLEMCLAATPDDPRPTKFETGPGLKQFRFTLKKKAKDFDPAKVDTFTVKVVDGEGKPVEGAVMGQTAFRYSDKAAEEWTYSFGLGQPPRTDKAGEVELTWKKEDQLYFNGLLYARHERRKLVALEPLSPARIMAGVTITLRPEAKLSGKVVCPGGVDPGPTGVYLCTKTTIYVLGYFSNESKFEFMVPVGDYRLLARGDYLSEEVAKGESGYPSLGNTVPVTVGPEGKELKLEAKPTKVAKLRGKDAPDLGEMADWKGNAVKLSDLKGKVVLLKFFTAGENTDIVRSMPSLVEHHNHYAAKGLVVVGVHYPSAFGEPVKTVKALDKELESIRTNEWPKGDIPFPVGLMAKNDGPATQAYGHEQEAILIDKKGKVVGIYRPTRVADLDRLEKLLDEK